VKSRAFFLFDASVICSYFLAENKREHLLYNILKFKESKKAFFYIPSFCISEVKNTFAKYRYRLKLINEDIYNEMMEEFTSMVTNRKIFYSYDLNRYHNLNTDEITPIEHTTATEFDYYDIKLIDEPRTQQEKDQNELKRNDVIEKIKDSKGKPKFWLSTFDILIISCGIELGLSVGSEKVFIISGDKRLTDICKKARESGKHKFPKAIDANRATVTDFKNELKKVN
jgi:uncharacterized LabA/DUF88 family protein